MPPANEPVVVKSENPLEPRVSPPPSSSSMSKSSHILPPDPKDPHRYLRKCSGQNKHKVRCQAPIGQRSQQAKTLNFTYLPTCHAHKDQKSHAGWCKYREKDGEICGRLFRWTPPDLQLCKEHEGHSDIPCYFMRLPLELRLEIYRYFLPNRPIDSSENPIHNNCLEGTTIRGSAFPFPVLDLFLVSHQVYQEAKDLLYSTVPFTIDVRKDGTFMCGRRLLEPRRADGSSHFSSMEDATRMSRQFIQSFDWAAVKSYNVDIFVENGLVDRLPNQVGPHYNSLWDEEVELYDIRDYIGVVVFGILSKSRNLCKLNVRLGISRFEWSHDELIQNVKTLLNPFVRLRNVQQPRLFGVFDGQPFADHIIYTPLPKKYALEGPKGSDRLCLPLCSVPQLPAHTLIMGSDNPAFSTYKNEWEKQISASSSSSVCKKPPILAMFTEFKEFYTNLALVVPEIASRHGRKTFMHRARVAREEENVEAFRHLRAELIEYWYLYLEQEKRREKDMNTRMKRMLNADIYPLQDCDSTWQGGSSATGFSDQSSTPLDLDAMNREGIPMQGNQLSQDPRYRLQLIRAQPQEVWAAAGMRRDSPKSCRRRIRGPWNNLHPKRYTDALLQHALVYQRQLEDLSKHQTVPQSPEVTTLCGRHESQKHNHHSSTSAMQWTSPPSLVEDLSPVSMSSSSSESSSSKIHSPEKMVMCRKRSCDDALLSTAKKPRLDSLTGIRTECMDSIEDEAKLLNFDATEPRQYFQPYVGKGKGKATVIPTDAESNIVRPEWGAQLYESP